MVIPFAAGGPTDVLGRVVAAKMGETLGQQVVVENVTGAGGQTGGKRVADSAPDGYNFVIGTVGTHAQAQTLYKKPLYNSQTDFTPVGLIAQVPIALIARKDLPVKDFKEFVAYAKANQAKMQFGSAGAGSATHLGCVLLNYMIGVNITHVPYRGTGPGDAGPDRRPHRLHLRGRHHHQVAARRRHDQRLALLDSKRSKALPDLPTAEEQGTKDLIAYTWNAIFLPKNAPDADREEAQRRDGGGDALAAREGQARRARRRDRAGQSGDAGVISPSSSRMRPRNGRSRSRRAASRWSEAG